MTNFNNLPKEFVEKFKATPHSFRHYQAYEKDEDFMDKLNAVKLNSQKEDKIRWKTTNKFTIQLAFTMISNVFSNDGYSVW